MSGRHLPRVDAHVRHFGAARHAHHFTEILLVLDPIQLDLETGKLSRVHVAVRDQFLEGFDHHRRDGRRLRVKVIQVQVHLLSAP